MTKHVYNEFTQLKRAENVVNVLDRGNLTNWARNYWSGVLKRLAKSQAQLDYSFNNVKPEEVIKNV
jgi:hypothetical protein